LEGGRWEKGPTFSRKVKSFTMDVLRSVYSLAVPSKQITRFLPWSIAAFLRSKLDCVEIGESEALIARHDELEVAGEEGERERVEQEDEPFLYDAGPWLHPSPVIVPFR
jgi:hypothetical protein